MQSAQHTSAAAGGESILAGYLDESRALVLDEIRRLVPADTEHTGGLYGLMLDYPLRAAKGLRPALCIASCRALCGRLVAPLLRAVLDVVVEQEGVVVELECGATRRP